MAIELSKSEASGGDADSNHDENGASTGVLGNTYHVSYDLYNYVVNTVLWVQCS